MLERFFNLREHGTTVRTEIIAGLTTFMTMAYIIVVNPAILENAGIPREACTVATILAAVFGTLLMGLYAKRPFAIAPYMGENAFIAFTVVLLLGYSWQQGLAAVFIGGVIFVLLTVLKLRSWLANAVPQGLKYSFAVGIGLFLTFIGLNATGIVTLGTPGAPVHIGNLHDTTVLLAIFGFVLTAFLMIKRVRGAILIGIIVTTLVGMLAKAAPLPDRWFARPPSLMPTLWKLNFADMLTWKFFAVILTVFIMDFVDTMGTLIGVSAKAGFLDEKGNLPQIERPMLCDALATVFGAAMGTTTTGTFIESASGVEEGGRTGLTAVVTAAFFLVALFAWPFLTAIPAFAYGPALILVGLLMLEPIKKINFTDYTEAVPAFAVITLMSFTYNIGVGITAGFVLYPFFKLVSGRFREIHPGQMILGVVSLLFFVFYPYK